MVIVQADSAPDSERICRFCKHSQLNGDNVWVCRRAVNVVTGDPPPCETVRMVLGCSAAGYWFEPSSNAPNPS